MTTLEDLPPFERLGDDELRHPRAEFAMELEEILELADRREEWPVRRECSPRYYARRTSGRRRLSEIRYLVVHCTQSSSAVAAARWFADDRSRGSAHVVVDDFECYRTLQPSMIPWGAPGVNRSGWHLELAGYAQWTGKEWMRRRSTLERGAFKLALHARAFGIPLQRLTNRELAAGRKRGVIDHRQASRVFGGSHWDVGDGFPWTFFLARARLYRRELGPLRKAAPA